LETIVAEEGLLYDAGGDASTALIRKLAGLQRIRCVRRPKSRKVRLTLSSTATRLLRLEPLPTKVAVFSLGEVFELWNVDGWRTATAVASIRTFAEELRDIVGGLMDEDPAD
jgi:hypothetical protein